MKPIPLTQPAAPAPRRFGKYLLVRKLAEGGMAELFLAKQVGAEGFERDVVVKCMLPHLSRHPDFVGMFLDEARLAARLFHPNIVQITDLGSAEGRYFLCMEYLPGEDLEALIIEASRRGEPVPVGVATRIILSACEGLEFAHGHQEGGQPVNLVHRDVSPSNILVTYQGTVKVVDFGIAKASSKLVQTQPGTLKGKLGYMSPEQARGEPLDARSDLFSLGVTFYELLTGQRVFQRETELGVLVALMERPVPPARALRPDLPEELDRIVMRMLARNREQRYQSAAELRADLEAILAGMSSVSGTTQVAQYLRHLFGPEQAQRRTRLPTLAELQAAGVVLPPSADAAEELGTAQTLVRTPVPDTGRAGRGSGLRGAVLGALGAVLVLGAGAAALLATRPQLLAGVQAQAVDAPLAPGVTEAPGSGKAPPAGAQEGATGRVDGAPAAAPAPAAKAPVAEEGGQPGGAAQAVPAGEAQRPSGSTATPAAGEEAPASGPAPQVARKPAAAAPAPSVGGRLTLEKQPVLLKEARVKRTIQRQAARIVACVEAHRAELPPDGTIHLRFTVRNTGKVEEVGPTERSQSLAGRPLVACLADVLGGMRFPENSNTPELVYAVPLRFQ